MRFLKDNGLTLALMVLFFGSLLGMVLTGWQVENEELLRHSRAAVSMLDYVFGHSFQSALFENWESEFLQMSAYVMMTAMLFQRGSANPRTRTKRAPPKTKTPPQKAAIPMRRGRPRRAFRPNGLLLLTWDGLGTAVSGVFHSALAA